MWKSLLLQGEAYQKISQRGFSMENVTRRNDSGAIICITNCYACMFCRKPGLSFPRINFPFFQATYFNSSILRSSFAFFCSKHLFASELARELQAQVLKQDFPIYVSAIEKASSTDNRNQDFGRCWGPRSRFCNPHGATI
jgi:hypothetical protein